MSSKSILRNERRCLNFLKYCDDYFRWGQKSKAWNLPTASADGNLWSVCDKLDRFQTIHGRDLKCSAVTIRILRWFTKHVCSHHVHKVLKKSFYAAHNSLDILISSAWFYFNLRRNGTFYRHLLQDKKNTSVSFEKQRIFLFAENLMFSK